ncbi:hypothetical protein OC835_004669 [Tilletia horrida]|nr:hypothetical protein OC835_004669 [Tilletia horrida]
MFTPKNSRGPPPPRRPAAPPKEKEYGPRLVVVTSEDKFLTLLGAFAIPGTAEALERYKEPREVDKEYKKFCLRWHPDKHGKGLENIRWATAGMQLLTSCYQEAVQAKWFVTLPFSAADPRRRVSLNRRFQHDAAVYRERWDTWKERLNEMDRAHMTEEERQREEKIKQARREAEEKEAEVRAQRVREEQKEKKKQEKEASRAAKKAEQETKNAPWKALSEHERQAVLQAKATFRNGQKKARKRLSKLRQRHPKAYELYTAHTAPKS